ncbi:hypothetical protein KY290_005525 [Solanum tuberosum]|uniref:Uncharacterized protein n=1 Tax=Solanum tuberosum TaxID=4113 RepID=A0ABQ7WG84_SOLTU|nr:hypothetical protein KY289_005913 [Solanum tuberosum]KAH0752309.1 hypothetical protein KY285_005457 [Solanum tuberosum]KAH0779098.1 hypothetical protein KY290_005525 [Solanum tuberosum]
MQLLDCTEADGPRLKMPDSDELAGLLNVQVLKKKNVPSLNFVSFVRTGAIAYLVYYKIKTDSFVAMYGV